MWVRVRSDIPIESLYSETGTVTQSIDTAVLRKDVSTETALYPCLAREREGHKSLYCVSIVATLYEKETSSMYMSPWY